MCQLPLEDYLALDLANDKGFLCGCILGDLGTRYYKDRNIGEEPSRKLWPFDKWQATNVIYEIGE